MVTKDPETRAQQHRQTLPGRLRHVSTLDDPCRCQARSGLLGSDRPPGSFPAPVSPSARFFSHFKTDNTLGCDSPEPSACGGRNGGGLARCCSNRSVAHCKCPGPPGRGSREVQPSSPPSGTPQAGCGRARFEQCPALQRLGPPAPRGFVLSSRGFPLELRICPMLALHWRRR